MAISSGAIMDEQKKSTLRTVLLTSLAAIGLVIAFVIASYLSESPSYDELSSKCVAKCNASGKFGNLVKQPGQASPKPSAQKFECVCS